MSFSQSFINNCNGLFNSNQNSVTNITMWTSNLLKYSNIVLWNCKRFTMEVLFSDLFYQVEVNSFIGKFLYYHELANRNIEMRKYRMGSMGLSFLRAFS